MRRRALLAAVTMILVVAACLAAAPEKDGGTPAGVLSILKPGQQVVLKDLGSNFQITVLEGGPNQLTHKVTEVGENYLVLLDIAGITESRIPIYSIKSVIVLNLKIKK